jgi:protein phosphatase
MKITIRRPLWFTEIGSKDNQEDFLWPSPAKVNERQRIFILCDGMGGQDSGEIASETAATSIGVYLTSHRPKDGYITEELLNDALSYAYDELDKKDNPSSQRKMGTTMACVILHRGGVLAAHIGDSRIYHIRPSLANTENGLSGIIYQSADHSLVNDLIRAGELTEEEAKTFSQKNVITRAMQPHLERRYKAEVYNIDDVQQGDFFFICCDGVLEQLSNEKLGSIISEESFGDEDKAAAIKSVCDGKTKDNYSCWLIPIDEVTREDSDKESVEEVVATVSSSLNNDDNNIDRGINNKSLAQSEVTSKKGSSSRKWFIGIVSFLILFFLCFFYFYKLNPTKLESSEKTTIDSISVDQKRENPDTVKKEEETKDKNTEVVKDKKSPTEPLKKSRNTSDKDVKSQDANSVKADSKPQEQEKPEEVNSVNAGSIDKKKNLLINNSKNQDSPNGKQ